MFWSLFKIMVIRAYDDVYPATGIDVVKYDNFDQRPFRAHPVTRISSFLGLPNNIRPDEEPSWLNILRNFVGLNNKTFLRYVFPLIFIFNLIATPLKFVLNITKLATEFVPMVVLGFLKAAHRTMSTARIFNKEWSRIVLHLVFTLIEAIPNYIHFMGRSATSPIKGILQAYAEGKQHGKKFSSNPLISKGFGFFMAFLSILSTTMIYSIIFPLGIKFLATTVFPNLPSLIVTALGSAAKGFSVLGNVLISIQNALLFGITIAPVAAMPEVVAVSGVIALFATLNAALFALTMRYFHIKAEAKKIFESASIFFPEGSQSESDEPDSFTYKSVIKGLGTSKGNSPCSESVNTLDLDAADDITIESTNYFHRSNSSSDPTQDTQAGMSFR